MDCKNYTHMRCECGGIVGMYDKKHFTCEKCGKNYDVMDIDSYDHFEVNEKTGWIFPMVSKKINLPKEEYEHYEKDGKRITVCTMRQKVLHTIGLNYCHTGRRLYTRHGKKYYKPYRNYFCGKDKDLDVLVEAGYMKRMEEIAHGEKISTYWFNREGLDWLGNQLGIYIYDEEN